MHRDPPHEPCAGGTGFACRTYFRYCMSRGGNVKRRRAAARCVAQFRRDTADADINQATGRQFPWVAPTMTGLLYHVVASAGRYALQPIRCCERFMGCLEQGKN